MQVHIQDTGTFDTHPTRTPHASHSAHTGVGPEIAKAVQSIFSAAEVPVTWDVQVVGKEVDPRTNSFVTRDNLDSVLVRDVICCVCLC